MKKDKLIKELKIISVIIILLNLISFSSEIFKNLNFDIETFIGVIIFAAFFFALKSKKIIGPIIGIIISGAYVCIALYFIISGYIQFGGSLGFAYTFAIFFQTIIAAIF